MIFFENEDFFLLYKNYLDRTIIKENDNCVGIKKESFPSLIEIAPSGTWTSLNFDKNRSAEFIKKSLKVSSRVLFTDINNIFDENYLKQNKTLKNFIKEEWFEADINLAKNSLEDITANFKRRVKRNLKRCLTDSKLSFFKDDSLVDEFINLHNFHANSKGYAPFSKEFIIDLLKRNANLFFIKYNDEIIGAHIMLYYDNIAFQYIHALKEVVYELRADDFFRYKLIEYAYNNHYNLMKFGGTPAKMKSLLDFKLGFGSEIKSYNIYTFYSSALTKQMFKIIFKLKSLVKRIKF